VPVLVVLALFVAAWAFVLWQLHNWKFERTERQHLAAIPIDVAACPNVVVMHKAAQQFQHAYPIFGYADDAYDRRHTWTETKAHIDQTAVFFEESITASLERFPPQVQWYLTIARDNLRAGRWQLALARDGIDLTDRTIKLEADGKEAFGFAGDLVGQQCSVPLGA
jgi:hypothetical protein